MVTDPLVIRALAAAALCTAVVSIVWFALDLVLAL